MLGGLLGRASKRRSGRQPACAAPSLEALEARNIPSVTSVLVGGVLTVTGDAGRDNIRVSLDEQSSELVVRSFAQEVARFAAANVTSIVLDGGAGRDVLAVDRQVPLPALLVGQDGDDILKGGGGLTTLDGGLGADKLVAGPGKTTLAGDGGPNLLFRVKPIDIAVAGPDDKVSVAVLPEVTAATPVETLNTTDVQNLLGRAAGATASNDAVIAIVDRNGRLLGMRFEGGVDPAITGDTFKTVFAADGALALARTGAFFANNQAPLTSRTIQFISQTTMTQREIESYPSITDPASTLRGPGFVAPIGLKGHFPPNVPFTPQVDLFAIEHTNRDSILHPGNDHIKGTADDTLLPNRFNIPDASLAPGVELFPPESYGFLSGVQPGAQARGIGTLPGGIPIYKNGQLVGGIGVFFPGKTGFATEMNSVLDANYDPTKPDRSLEAEFIAFAAVGGAPGINLGVGDIAGIPSLGGLPLTPTNGRIDLVGITLDIVGPGGTEGPLTLARFGETLASGDPNSGVNLPVNAGGDLFIDGLPVSEGWLVMPQDGVGVTADEVRRVILDGIEQAYDTRAAIRLPLNSETRMVLAVSDLAGNVVGLFRMPDATVFSIDVAVAKSRNVTYYASNDLQPIDQLPGVALNTAFTNRSFRFLSLPRYPEGIDGMPPGPFSILNDGGVNANGQNFGPTKPAFAYQSVQGYDAFNPGTNFRDPDNILNQNGIVFFPGSAPMYRGDQLIGGYGISGDGVDQDDVVTVGGIGDLDAPDQYRVDRVFVKGVRVPYHKFNRNPEGGIT